MYFFTDTEDSIHPPTPEEDAAYADWGTSIKADAVALMATVHHLLTGMEIATLEAAIDQDGGKVDMAMFEALRNQFYAQMTNHQDRRAHA